MQRLSAILTLVLALSGFATSASAQVGNQRLAEINRAAMEAYNNLDIETAKKSLEDVARSAERGGTKGPGLARTYANLGVVLVGGLGEQSAGLDAFVRALREDPNVEPDPIVATPEVMSVFNKAKSKAGSSSASPASAPAPLPELVPATGNLDHTPVTEQLAQTPVPVFVKKSDDLEIETMKIFYRSLGMRQPGKATMTSTGDGWAYLVPCYDVSEPSVEYFIVAEDADGNRVGNFGEPNAPVTVNIVSTRTEPAPSLPGQPPPKTCSSVNETECPPGLPGCRSGSKQLGDTCSADDDCSSGLVCDDDFCALGERAGGSSSKKDTSFFFEAAFGLGLTYVSESSTADRSINQAQLEAARGTSNDPMAVGAALRRQGYDCDVALNENNQIVAGNCGLAVDAPGFVAVPALHLAAGYYFTPKLNVALTGRIQLKSGTGTLAGIGIGVRGEYLLTKPKPKGFRAGLLVGAALGSVQAQPSGGKDGPFATSALPGGVGVLINAGLRLNYRLHKNFGIVLTPALLGAMPKFLFTVDLSAGVEVAF